MFRMPAQEALSHPHEIVEPTGRLHGRRCRYHRRYHQHHIDRGRRGLKPEQKHEHRSRGATRHTEPYAAQSGTGHYGSEHKNQLQYHPYRFISLRVIIIAPQEAVSIAKIGSLDVINKPMD